MAYKQYSIKEGDCISSIAYENSLFPDTVWNDSKNSELKKKRKNPNALFPGDVVYIRDKEVKEESCACEQKHRFRRKGVPEKLRIRFLDVDEEPKEGIPYILIIKTKSGRPVPSIKNKTDPDGFLNETIPPDASEGEIRLGEGDDQKSYPIKLGHLDPIDTISGVQARLNNLGYDCGEEDGVLDEETREAIRAFQRDNDLEEIKDDAEKIDEDTLDKIEEKYSG